MDYQKLYRDKTRCAQDIAAAIQPGWSCCSDIAVCPPGLSQALHQRAAAGQVSGVALHALLDLAPNPLLEGSAAGVTPVSWFSGGGLRRAVNGGHADIMPCYYRDMPGLFTSYVEVDAFVTIVSPMDRHGYFSTGTTTSNSAALIQAAKRIYLEVNPRMPRSLYGPQIHISQVTALCEHDAPLPIVPPVAIDEVSRTIGRLIAEEVPDGATLQLGIGAIPEAVGLALKDKRELGIHTELFTDSMAELLACGAATNQRKPIHRGKTVATFTFGSQRIYDLLNDNPSIELLPVDYVNNPETIAKHPHFVSVNSAVEVDFFGQVCAESAGTQHISGTGGQTDYVRGAVQSKGGKSFIAFPSTAKNGTVSRICATLAPGALVSTSKNDVDHIVTEYGIAKLRGKTLSQRAKALIAIAHPSFREALTHQAKAQNILI